MYGLNLTLVPNFRMGPTYCQISCLMCTQKGEKASAKTTLQCGKQRQPTLISDRNPTDRPKKHSPRFHTRLERIHRSWQDLSNQLKKGLVLISEFLEQKNKTANHFPMDIQIIVTFTVLFIVLIIKNTCEGRIKGSVLNKIHTDIYKIQA